MTDDTSDAGGDRRSAADPVFFEIAAYRLSEDDWYADIERQVAESVARSVVVDARFGHASTDEDVRRARSLALASVRPTGWDYNEVVAWLRLHAVGGGHVKGYLWQVAHRQADGSLLTARIRKGFKPYPFEFGYPVHKVVESLYYDEPDEEIYAALRNDLIQLTRRGEILHRRHLDLRAFDALGPVTAWRTLLGLRES